jgi:hypothetical protein
LTEEPKLRFAVGAFDAWSQLREALRDARISDLVLKSFNCIALERVFAETTIVAPTQERLALQALPFSDSSELIVCTSGPLAKCLQERLDSGAESLKAALGHWLIPRHAAYFEDAVKVGKILLWIRVGNADEERRAYQNLLAHSSSSVGVHDLVLPGH